MTDRERSYSWVDPMTLAAESRSRGGLEYLDAIVRGELPHPPICATIGFRIAEVSEGRCVIELEPGEHQYNTIGLVHGAVVVAALDSAAGSAVHTTCPAGTGYSTIDLTTTFTRAISRDTGTLRCEGTLINRGRRVALSQARLVGPDGKLYAHGTTTCLILE